MTSGPSRPPASPQPGQPERPRLRPFPRLLDGSPAEPPADEHELDEFRGCFLEASERWARQCIADRHVEVEGV